MADNWTNIKYKNLIMKSLIEGGNKEPLYIFIKLSRNVKERDKLELQLNEYEESLLNNVDEEVKFKLEASNEDDYKVYGIIDESTNFISLIKLINNKYQDMIDKGLIKNDSKENNLITTIRELHKNYGEDLSGINNNIKISINDIVSLKQVNNRVLNARKVSKTQTSSIYKDIYMYKEDYRRCRPNDAEQVFGEKPFLLCEVVVNTVFEKIIFNTNRPMVNHEKPNSLLKDVTRTGKSSDLEINKAEVECKDKEFELIGIFNIDSSDEMGVLVPQDYIPLNLLLKGVPGTGKSRLIDEIIRKHLKINNRFISKQVLRLNIHSSTANTDLMYGIGVETMGEGAIRYKEKIGIVLNHIVNAIRNPRIPYVLIFEEIQENSLNELIGDLIYLIDKDKRTDVSIIKEEDIELLGNKDIFVQIEEIIKIISNNMKDKNVNYVDIPFLIESKTTFRKMILPKNLYFFVTTNYRSDKKILEDNLFRRFEVIDIFPKYEYIYKNHYVGDFLKEFNDQIKKEFKDDFHPDRLLAGHSNWMHVNNKVEFYRALLKLINEYKEIKEIDFMRLKRVFENLRKNNIKVDFEDSNIQVEDLTEYPSYNELIDSLLNKCEYIFLEHKENNILGRNNYE